MTWLAGVDGCRGGWLVALEERGSGVRAVRVLPDFASALALRPRPALIAVDMPLGLPERGARACDVEARRRLGPRAGSRVFPAPPRALLDTRSHPEAVRLSRALQGKGISRQVFAILPRVRELDEALARRGPTRVFEVHPELSFCAMAHAERALPPKRSAAGREARLRLVRAAFDGFELDGLVPRRRLAAADDVLDAFAALWSARRLWSGRARAIPTHPPRDARGLQMAIWT